MSDDPIYITEVTVENLYRLKAAHVTLDPKGGLVVVMGKNRQGKTSFLRALAGVLGGKGHVADQPINTESETGTGFVTLRLDNGFRIERYCSPGDPKGKLDVVGADGTRHGQTQLNDWLGRHAFDPLAFFTLAADRQREVLLSLGTDPELPAKLKRLDEERQKLYDSRVPWNRQLQRAQRVASPEGDRPAKVDTTAEVERLQALQGKKDARDKALKEADTVLTRATTQKQLAEEKAKEVVELEEKLEQAIRQRDALWANHSALETEGGAMKEAADALPNPVVEIEEVQGRIAAADAIMEELEPWHEYDRAQTEKKEAEAEAGALTEQIAAIDQQKTDMLRNAGIEIPGLDFDPEGMPLLWDQPLELASGRERIVMGARAAILADPDLRVCLLDSADPVDDEGMRELLDIAQESNFQLVLCRIEPTSFGELIYVDDGIAQQKEGDS